MKLWILALAVAVQLCTAHSNRAWVFRIPTAKSGGKYIAGQTVALEDVPMPPAPKPGQLQVRTAATSVIPSYRGRMNPDGWPAKAEYLPFVIDKPVVIDQVLEVMESNAPGFAKGDLLLGSYPLSEYQNIMADGSDNGMPPSKLDPSIPIEKFLSITSFSGGLTSWHVVYNTEVGAVDSPCTKTVLITSAGSTVGSLAGQMYKEKGCKVIGAVSTREKANQIMEELGGFDAIIAYKEEDFATRLSELAPSGIDIDFENVGGSQLDTALAQLNKYGKVILCGLISDYNKPAAEQHGVGGPAAFEIILKSLRVEGIMVVDIIPVIGKALTSMSQMIASGKLKSAETVIYGFDSWGKAIDMMLASESLGRLVVKTDAPVKKEL